MSLKKLGSQSHLAYTGTNTRENTKHNTLFNRCFQTTFNFAKCLHSLFLPAYLPLNAKSQNKLFTMNVHIFVYKEVHKKNKN